LHISHILYGWAEGKAGDCNDQTRPQKQWNNYGCSHSADVENIVLIRGLIEDSDSKFKDELVAWFDDRMDVLMSALWGVVP
jgi:hypothetical protein